MLDLDSTNPEVATIQDVEYDKRRIASEFIASEKFEEALASLGLIGTFLSLFDCLSDHLLFFSDIPHLLIFPIGLSRLLYRDESLALVVIPIDDHY